MMTVMHLWALTEESKVLQMHPESLLYNDLPAHPNNNIGIPWTIQLSQPPQIQVSPIIGVGEHESDVCQDSQPPMHHALDRIR